MLDRDARYANYEDLIADLDAIAEGRRGSRAARSLLRWAAAVVVLGGAGFAGYQARAEIADFVRTAFAGAEPQPTAPVVDSDPDAPQPPPVDLSGMQAEIDAIRAAIPDAVDLAALATLTDRSNALSRTLDGVPPTAEVADLRAEIATANEEIGARSLLLEEVEQRRGRQDEIDRIRSRVEAGEDLAGALGDLDTLIDGIPPGTSWDGIRTAAKQLRTQGRVRWYSSRLADAERLLDQPGPQAAATPASSLVADLARETSEADFGALRDRAQKLESDVQAGLEFERRLPSRPNASWPFAEVAEWTRGVRSAADATSKEAHTEILGRWVEASARSRLADPSLTAGCRAELERAWQECTTAREQNDARRAAELNRELTAAIENLAELGTLDPAEVVSPVARAELVAWIAQSSKTEEVIEDVRQAIRVQREVGTLNAWLGKRAAAQSVRAELRARVAAEDIAEADDLTQVLAELDAGIAYWTTVTERVDSALQSTTKADLDGAARILELRDLAAGDRDPAAIPEVAAIVEAVRDLRQGFDRALTGLDPVAAAQSFQRAETAFARLPEGLAGAAGAAGYARRCAERAGTLGEAARNMAAVPAGRVEIAVGQAGIDGTYDVAAFYLDRHEVDRATFKRALDGAGLRSISADELRELQGRDWDSRPDFPALGISRAAAADCLRLSGRTLPTHAEWWLAAKGPGANTAFPWGGTWSDGGLEVRAEPLEVRSDRRPLAVGGTEVHFLVGNAAEWVGDLLANGTRGAVAGGGIDYSLGALRDAALGKVRVVAPSGRIDRSVGARGVIRPADHFGDLAPVRR
jgi:formylglycine-generating enzyme required for sulfatase activity